MGALSFHAHNLFFTRKAVWDYLNIQHGIYPVSLQFNDHSIVASGTPGFYSDLELPTSALEALRSNAKLFQNSIKHIISDLSYLNTAIKCKNTKMEGCVDRREEKWKELSVY